MSYIRENNNKALSPFASGRVGLWKCSHFMQENSSLREKKPSPPSDWKLKQLTRVEFSTPNSTAAPLDSSILGARSCCQCVRRWPAPVRPPYDVLTDSLPSFRPPHLPCPHLHGIPQAPLFLLLSSKPYVFYFLSVGKCYKEIGYVVI